MPEHINRLRDQFSKLTFGNVAEPVIEFGAVDDSYGLIVDFQISRQQSVNV
jgi:hypothetical protein